VVEVESEAERRFAQLEARVAAIEAQIAPPAVLGIIARVIGERAFKVRDLYDYAALADNGELRAALAATTPRKLGQLLSRSPMISVVETSSAGLTYIIRRSDPRIA
jgi:hypothetical protein